MKGYALITGASSGIGLELAKLCAADGYNVVLVARGRAALQELAAKLRQANQVKALVYATDLSAPGAVEKLYDHLKQQKITVEILINNAGFGDAGPLIGADWDKLRKMIDLNITALTRLSKLYGREMSTRGRGKILNLASLAAFLPGPNMAVYYATKHYVLAFSESLASELRSRGVSVTALCPGPTESGFVHTAHTTRLPTFDRKLPSAKAAAACGYRAMQRGQAVAVYPLSARLLAFSTRLLPRWLMRGLVRKAQEPKS